MTDKLVDSIGYDSIDMREAMRADGSYMEGFPVRLLIENNMQSALVIGVGTAKPEVAEAECEVCHCYLGPHPGDDNHHSSVFETPVRHYCAAHCPACNHDDLSEVRSMLMFGSPGFLEHLMSDEEPFPDGDDEQIIERRPPKPGEYDPDDDFVGGGAEEEEPKDADIGSPESPGVDASDDEVDDNGGDDGFVWS